MRTASNSLRWVRDIWWSLCCSWSFSLRGWCQYRITCGITHCRGYYFIWIRWWISYSVMAWRSLTLYLITYHGVLRSCLLASLKRRFCDSSIYIFVRDISSARWADISRLLHLISTSERISIRLCLLGSWSNRRYAVTLRYIFTKFWISRVSNCIKLRLLL